MYHIVKSEETKIGRFEVVLDTIEKHNEEAPYSYIRMKENVTVIPILPDGKILLLKEYRHAIRKWMYEFPSGMIEPGEAIEEAAKRELLEETGLIADRVCSLGFTYPSFGSTTEKIDLFYAECHIPEKKEEKDKAEKAEKDILEEMEQSFVTREELEAMIKRDEFVHGAGEVAWLKYLLSANL